MDLDGVAVEYDETGAFHELVQALSKNNETTMTEIILLETMVTSVIDNGFQPSPDQAFR